RPITRASSCHCFRRQLVDLEHVVAVNNYPGKPVSSGPACNIGVPRRAVECHLRCIEVVLADIDYRKIPYHSEIQSLVERAYVYSTVVEKSYCDLTALGQLRAQSCAGGHCEPRTHNAVGSHETMLRRIQVHATAASARTPGGSAKQFSHNIARWNSLSQR